MRQVKDKMRDQHGIDLGVLRDDYGPADPESVVVEGKEKAKTGRDFHFRESDILRLCVARHYVVDDVVPDLLYHMQWRQTNVPMPRLTNATLHLLNQGIIYIHGRTRALAPILVIDFGKLKTLLERKEINPGTFCSVHNFVARYMLANMMVFGQVDKWVVIANINQFPIKSLPVQFFKDCARELTANFIDLSSKQIVVNLTWV